MALELLVIGGLLLLALVGVRGWVRRRRARPLPGWRLAAWLAGLGLVWVATASPLAGLDRVLLTAHMLKHLVLMTVAAPLLLVSEPIALLGWGLGGERARVPAVLAASGRVLTHPVLCWLAGTATVLAWHVPAAMSLAMHSAAGHAAQSASFLAGGLLFWWPVVQPWPARPHWPAWMVPLYLLLATLPCDALSAFLAFCGRPVYTAALWAAAPEQLLGDQERAGALMWVWVTLVYLVPAVWQVLRLLGPTARSEPGHCPGGTKLSW
jgi:cytochrome c oxidase assembly factor CtaG